MKKSKKIIYSSAFIILLFLLVNNGKEILESLSYRTKDVSYKKDPTPQKLQWYDSFKGINNMSKKEENTKRSYFNQ